MDGRRVEHLLHRLDYASQGAGLSLHVEDPNDEHASMILDGWFVAGVDAAVNFMCKELSIDLPKEETFGYTTDPGGPRLPFSMRPNAGRELRRILAESEWHEGQAQVGEAPPGADGDGGRADVPVDGRP
jgi:hypothetical protein